MESPKVLPFSTKAMACLLLLCFMCLSANSARLLDEQPQASVGTPVASNVVGVGPPAASNVVGPSATTTSNVVGASATATSNVVGPSATSTVVGPSATSTVVGPSATSTVVGPPAASSVAGVGSPAASNVVGSPGGNPGQGATTTPTATLPSSGGIQSDYHTLSFFMHDILGGSNPSARAVTGVVNNPAVNGQLPFAKPNGAVLSVGNNVPQDNGNSGLINNNNLPFLIGLGGTTSPLLQNNGGNNFNGGVGFPSANAGQLPSGVSIQQLMFGTMTVIDDELTEGHELGSGLIGKAQGFYVVSSEDGNSQTMAFTTMFQSGNYVDSLSFFGVHRTAVSESHLAIMGGTGKYVNAKGYANVKTLPPTNQHETDGVETLLHFTVYITY